LSEGVLDAVYVSPSLRARETIQPFVDKTKVEIVVESDLQEVDFGLWEGMSFKEIHAQSPELVTQWALNRMGFCFPGGERLDTFWERVCRIGNALASAPVQRVAVVTHGGVIRYLICHFLGLAPEQHRMFHIDLGSITTLTLHDGFAVLKGLNVHE
jgi:broad specificity phosphatase PhoE